MCLSFDSNNTTRNNIIIKHILKYTYTYAERKKKIYQRNSIFYVTAENIVSYHSGHKKDLSRILKMCSLLKMIRLNLPNLDLQITSLLLIINYYKMYFKDKRFHFNRTFKREILQTHKTSPNIE